MMMLRDPPLVEMPTATSSGRACAMSWRRKMTSVPMSLATAVMFAGSTSKRHRGNRLIAAAAEARNRSPSRWRRWPSRRCRRGSACRRAAGARGSPARRCRSARPARAPPGSRSAASSCTFIRMEAATSAIRSVGVLLFAAQKRIEKVRLAHVVAQLAVLEEDVHAFPTACGRGSRSSPGG